MEHKPYIKEQRKYYVIVEGEKLMPEINEALKRIDKPKHYFGFDQFVKQLLVDVIYINEAPLTKLERRFISRAISFLLDLQELLGKRKRNKKSKELTPSQAWKFYSMIAYKVGEIELGLSILIKNSAHDAYNQRKSFENKTSDIYCMLRIYRRLERLFYDVEFALSLEESENIDDSNKYINMKNAEFIASGVGSNKDELWLKVIGDSLNDGTSKTIGHSYGVFAKEIPVSQWCNRKIDLNNYSGYYVLQHKEGGFSIKKIVNHNIKKKEIICSNLNPDKEVFPDTKVNTDDVNKLFEVVHTSRTAKVC